ncbi:MAG: DmsE family decaheme c-type cytochrome [Bryobacteraceae bacterium]|nr:DmsE family decaheme c-type cytochrome [Bryobacteraceae bacterium]
MTPRRPCSIFRSALLVILFSAVTFAQRTYVGSQRCGICHAGHRGWVSGSLHAGVSLTTAGGEKVAGCETCHGPGSEHVQKIKPGTIFAFKTEPAAQRSAACLACHSANHPERNFRRSDHLQNKVGCDDCHAFTGSESFHSMKAADDVMTRAQPELCYQCHDWRRADFAMPYHHPVPEGFMACSDCHEPHGSFTVRQLRTRHSEMVCGKCHEDQQGPFIFEHPPGRAAGCQACHQPHGSTNPRMLTRAEARFLCLECHPDTASFHDLSQVTYQNCTVCHNRIHGSNLSRRFLE